MGALGVLAYRQTSVGDMQCIGFPLNFYQERMRACLLFVLEIPWPGCTFDKWVLSFREGSPWPEPGTYLSSFSRAVGSYQPDSCPASRGLASRILLLTRSLATSRAWEHCLSGLLLHLAKATAWDCVQGGDFFSPAMEKGSCNSIKAGLVRRS